MKTSVLTALAVAAAALASPALASDPTGLWQTPTNGGQVRIERCGQALCGVLVTSSHIRADPNVRDARNKDESLRTRPLRGLRMLSGFTGGPTFLQPPVRHLASGRLAIDAAKASLAAREVVFPTGKERGGWIEVLDSDDNIGWVQNERLTPTD